MAYTPINKTLKKTNKLKKLTDAQKKKLQDHSKHHTKKHMAMMRMMMMKGKSFADAHAEAKKKVGK